MRLIADGLVDREGVDGLARRVGYTPRHLGRLLTQELGAGAAGTGPGPSRAERPGAHRDHRPAADRRRLRGRLRQRPPVQRDAARDLRRLAERAARPPDGRAVRAAPSSCGCRSARRSPGGGCSTSSPSTSCRGSRSRARLVRPHPRPAPRPRHRPARRWPTSRPGRGTGFVTRRVPAATTCATPLPPVERVRRLLDADCDPRAVDEHLGADPRARRPRRGRLPGCGSPARSTATRPPSARSSASRSASPAPAPSAAGSSPSTAGRSSPPVAGPHPPLPRRRHPGRASTRRPCRCRGRGAGRSSGSPRPSPTARWCSTAAPTATTYALRCWPCPASAPGPPTTSRCAPSGTPTSSCPPTSAVRRVLGSALARLGRHRARWRPWRSYALMHLWNTLDARAPPAPKEN